MLLSLLVVLAVIFLSGHGINWGAILYLPVIMLVEYVLALGVAMITSAVTVYIRDLEYLLGIITMAWQFLTPIMYSMEIVPESVLPIFNLNPMTPIIIAYRDILYGKKPPEISTLMHATLLGILLLCVGCLVFKELKRHFAEEL